MPLPQTASLAVRTWSRGRVCRRVWVKMKWRSLPNLKSTDTVNGRQIVSATLLIPFLDPGLIAQEVHSEKRSFIGWVAQFWGSAL